MASVSRVEIRAGKDTVAVKNEPIQLRAQGGTDYLWKPATGLNTTRVADPMATLEKDQTYVVEGRTDAGCKGYDTLQIKVYEMADVYVPTAFTPNGDGKNDFFRPTYVGVKELVALNIYNRWGELVFATADPSMKWDGTFAGNKQATQVYIWQVSAISAGGQKIQKKGTFVLIR